MEERRKARVGTVGGLAPLTGGTTVAAAGGGGHSVFATVALGLLALGMSHALRDEIRRQATRGSPGGWAIQDTVNTVLLIGWAIAALVVAVLHRDSLHLGGLGAALTAGYASAAAWFVRLRLRTVRIGPPGTAAPGQAAAGQPADHTTITMGTDTPADHGSTVGSGTQSSPSTQSIPST